jgi:hypothetical protein
VREAFLVPVRGSRRIGLFVASLDDLRPGAQKVLGTFTWKVYYFPSPGEQTPFDDHLRIFLHLDPRLLARGEADFAKQVAAVLYGLGGLGWIVAIPLLRKLRAQRRAASSSPAEAAHRERHRVLR